MKRRMMCAMILLVGFTTPALGDYYRFLDGKGQVRFTDDLNQIPADLRSNAEKFTGPARPKPGDAPGEGPPPGQITADVRTRLEAQKAELDQTYADLMARSARLDAEDKRGLTGAQREAHDRQRRDLNREIRHYELKRQILEAEIEVFQDVLQTDQNSEADIRLRSELEKRETLLRTEHEDLVAEKDRLAAHGPGPRHRSRNPGLQPGGGSLQRPNGRL